MKKLNRISKLLTALIIVMLLNIILLLLPSVLKPQLKSVEGQTSSPESKQIRDENGGLGVV